MGDFSAEWLALREPADRAARSSSLVREVAGALAAGSAPQILDLAAGTGSNYRYLAGTFPDAGWLLADHDAALLAKAPKTRSIDTRVVNLARLDDRSLFDGRALVTASALLDLVSEEWLSELADQCVVAGAAALFALSYDGRIECSPPDTDDAFVVALVNEHQRTDKGFGPALGSAAVDCAESSFRARGYQTRRAPSDWILRPASQELQRALIDGWAQAATELRPLKNAVVEAWRQRRHAHVDGNRSSMIVGHEDLIGILGFEDLRTCEHLRI
jgi:hypothetical protein